MSVPVVRHPTFLIDPPGPFSPRSHWIEFLAEMKAQLVKYPGHPQFKEMVADAEVELARRDGDSIEY